MNPLPVFVFDPAHPARYSGLDNDGPAYYIMLSSQSVPYFISTLKETEGNHSSNASVTQSSRIPATFFNLTTRSLTKAYGSVTSGRKGLIRDISKTLDSFPLNPVNYFPIVSR